MDETCEIIPSQKGNDKINVRDYLMVKDRTCQDTFYWYCEKRKLENCRGRAITLFIDGSHYLKKFIDHHHSPQASKATIAKTIAQIKKRAYETRDTPTQIIQNKYC